MRRSSVWLVGLLLFAFIFKLFYGIFDCVASVCESFSFDLGFYPFEKVIVNTYRDCFLLSHWLLPFVAVRCTAIHKLVAVVMYYSVVGCRR